MKWEELTAQEFKEAVATTQQTCLVPLGVIEKHGDHLPLGTDLINVRKLAARTAAIEPVVIFPSYYFGQISEARHQPGTLSFDARFLLDSLQNVCHEIARNGFTKIILLNGHGGNSHFLPFFAQTQLNSVTAYQVYVTDLFALGQCVEIGKIITDRSGGHADELETALMLRNRPDLVKMDRVDLASGEPLQRLNHLANVYTAIWWYADYPDHFAGNPTAAAAEKGERLFAVLAEKLAATVKAIKQDTTVAQLQREFYQKADHLCK